MVRMVWAPKVCQLMRDPLSTRLVILHRPLQTAVTVSITTMGTEAGHAEVDPHPNVHPKPQTLHPKP